jgi:hypothetical protein
MIPQYSPTALYLTKSADDPTCGLLAEWHEVRQNS